MFLDQLKLKKTALDEELQISSSKCDYYQDQIQKLEETIHQNELEKEMLLQNVQDKNENIREIKEQCQAFKHILDKIIIKVSKMAADHQKTEFVRQKLLEENKILGIKAGIGFEGLTPRPNYQQIFEEKNLKFSNFFQKTKDKMTTLELIQMLLTKICEYQGKLFIMQTGDNRKKPDPMKTSLRRPAATATLEKNIKKPSILITGGVETPNQKKSSFSDSANLNLKTMEISMFNPETMVKDPIPEIIEENTAKKEIVDEIIQAKEALANLA